MYKLTMNPASQQALLKTLIRNGINKYGSATAFADKAGVKKGELTHWMKGRMPGMDKFLLILQAVGGDITRAMPDYEPPVEAEPMMWVEGQVAAGSAARYGEDRYRVPCSPSTWVGTEHYHLTYGEAFIVEVQGDSMLPRYKSGDWIVCRKPIDPLELPDNTPVLFVTEDDEWTFKIHARSSTRNLIITRPLNDEFPMATYAPGEIGVAAIAIGHLERRMKTTRRATVPQPGTLPKGVQRGAAGLKTKTR